MKKRKALVVIVWHSPPTAAEKKVLLLRLRPDRGGYWQSVTGGVDPGESYSEGALREAMEESGLRFDRHPQYLGLEHSFPSRWGGQARERAFYLPIFDQATPPTPALDGKEHDDFAWLAPEEAMALVKHKFNQEAIERATTGSAPLLLTKRGSFFQDGEEITHERTAELLHRSLTREKNGVVRVRVSGEILDVILEDNPRYARSYERSKGEITLSDGSKEKLNPESLRIRADNSLACTLANGWDCTFLSPAYYEISKDIRESVEGSGKYVLNFLGCDYELAIPH